MKQINNKVSLIYQYLHHLFITKKFSFSIYLNCEVTTHAYRKDDVRSIRARTLLIQGGQDTVSSHRSREMMKHQISNSRIVTIRGMGYIFFNLAAEDKLSHEISSHIRNIN